MRRRRALALAALSAALLGPASAQTRMSTAEPEELDQEVGERTEQIDAAERDLMVTRDALGDRRAVLHQRLRSIYKRGPLNSVQVLLTAESFGDLINRYKYLFLIARHDRQLVKEVALLEGQLESRERLLVRTLNALQDEQAERALVPDPRPATRAAPAAPRAETPAQRSARVEAGERVLRALVAGIERSRTAPAPGAGSAAAATRPATTATLTDRDAGTLSWPVQGELVYRFGRQGGGAIRWSGVGIGAAAGSQVRAVEEGKVVMAGPFEGFGPSVVVSHGGGYYSLYLYLQRVSVREGETIGRNQVVGAVGGAGTPEGPHVEFQLRGPAGEALDPLEWLRSPVAE
jgi:murein hydrolase activator